MKIQNLALSNGARLSKAKFGLEFYIVRYSGQTNEPHLNLETVQLLVEVLCVIN